MTMKKFRIRFFLTIIYGLLVGMPIAVIYAAFMTHIPAQYLSTIIIISIITGIVVVVGLAVPTNLLLMTQIAEFYVPYYENRLEPSKYYRLFKRLSSLPMINGWLIFFRVTLGAFIVAGLTFFNTEIPLAQMFIICIVGTFGAYIGGITSYMATSRFTRAVREKIISEKKIKNEELCKTKFYGLNIIKSSLYFILIPMFYTNFTIIISIYFAGFQQISFAQFSTRIAILVLLNLIIIIVSGLLILSEILRPLKTFKSYLTVLSNRSGDLRDRIPTDLTNEFSEIARLINLSLDHIAEIFSKLRESGNALGTSINTLKNSTSSLSLSTAQQSSSIKEISSTIQESSRLSLEINQDISQVHNLSEETVKQIENGRQMTVENNYNMKEIKKTSDQTVNSIKSLNEQIDSIWEIVEMINSVADQTKIIAFNAELEASSAGDSGKNFEIVAGEIRRLADHTVESTGDIQKKIREIQNSSRLLVQAGDKVTDKIENGSRISKETSSIFEKIVEITNLTLDSSSQIHQKSRHQAESSKQILETIHQINNDIEHLTESAKTNQEITETINKVSDNIRTITSQYKI